MLIIILLAVWNELQDMRVQFQIDSDQWKDQKIICYNHIFKYELFLVVSLLYDKLCTALWTLIHIYISKYEQTIELNTSNISEFFLKINNVRFLKSKCPQSAGKWNVWRHKNRSKRKDATRSGKETSREILKQLWSGQF